MAARPPDAFLSYTRFNDQHDGGAISEFCRRLASAVQAVTGIPFEIFQDVGGIGIGEHWPGKLDRMLDQTRFFIPILTPSYFTSEPCRDELEKFLRAEAERERNDLVLPIYYIESEVLEDAEVRAADPLARALHERQRQDWRDLRFEPFEAANVRKALEGLAREIVKARRRPMLKPAGGSAVKPAAPPAPPFQQPRPEAVTQIRRMSTLRRSPGLKAAADPRRSRAPSFQPGTVFRDVDAPWCPELVIIPPGEFMMGSTEAERQWAVHRGAKQEWLDWEKPQRRVVLADSLAVGRYPATFEEYGYFARRTGRAQPADEGWGRGRRPVINVGWNDAAAFVAWLSTQTNCAYRLLSEAEWEYACRGGTTSYYWWGDEIAPANANYGRNVGETSEVGSYPPNPFGLYDMHGNVWEWVEDRWHDSYVGAPADGSAWTAGDGARRVLRGGSWNSGPGILRSANRGRNRIGYRQLNIGFRVARMLSHPEDDA